MSRSTPSTVTVTFVEGGTESFEMATYAVDVDARSDHGFPLVVTSPTKHAVFAGGIWARVVGETKELDVDDPEVLRGALKAAVEQLERLAGVAEALASEARNRGLEGAKYVQEQVEAARTLLSKGAE